MELEEKLELAIDTLQLYEKQIISRALKQEWGNEWSTAKISYEEALKKEWSLQKP